MTPSTPVSPPAAVRTGDSPAQERAHQSAQSIATDLLGRYGTVVFFVLIVVVFSLLSPRFLTGGNVVNILRQSSMLAIVAAGLTLCVAAGEFDLSTGSVASLGGILGTGLIVNQGFTTAYAIGIAVFAGVGFGLLNGLLVSVLRIPSLIATLGTSAIAIGVNYAYSNGSSVYGALPEGFRTIGQGYLGPIPVAVVIAVIVFIVAYLLLEKTRAGRYLIATGANSLAARLTGVPVRRMRMLGLLASGTFAAFAGVVLASYLGTGQPNGGDNYTLVGLTAVFVGMSMIRPGQANMIGTLVGVLLLGVVSNGLNLLGTPFWVQELASGIILVAAVALAVIKEELRFF
jgi:ribose transport system permease protein